MTSVIVSPTPQTLTFDVVLNTAGQATVGYSVSIRWDGWATVYMINASATEHLPAGFDYNPTPGITVVQSGPGTQGTGDDYDAATSTSPPVSGIFTIGTITVTSTIAWGAIWTTSTTGEGVLDSSGLGYLPVTHVGAYIVPEPASAGLLGLGLAGLVVAAGRGRRRRA